MLGIFSKTHTVSRNGLQFQVPISNFCRFRFAVHSSGTGTGWEEASPDVDQPHGLDFRELQDIRKGVRKRIEQEHATFADNTVGGIHTPGGAAILGIEDGTASIVADGTLKGHGMVWDNTSRIWCATAVAGASTTGDWTLVLINPDKQWAGGDVTWLGSHEFSDVGVRGDMSVDGTITGSIVVDGTFTFATGAGALGAIFNHFGDYTGRAMDTTYTAATDGFLVGFVQAAAATRRISARTAGVNRMTQTSTSGGYASASALVKKGSTYWLAGDVTTYSDSTAWFLPFGDNTNA